MKLNKKLNILINETTADTNTVAFIYFFFLKQDDQKYTFKHGDFFKRKYTTVYTHFYVVSAAEGIDHKVLRLKDQRLAA